MAAPGGEKPYRVYRGGRQKGKVPTIAPPGRQRQTDGDGKIRYSGPGPKPQRRRRFSWRRRILLAVIGLLLLLAIWIVASYLSFSSGVNAANKRLPASARRGLTSDKGLIMQHPSDTLLLGTDHSLNASRTAAHRSDSIMVLRTDPQHHRLVYLSIPRDLRVPDIPGHGPDKINAAMQLGGPSLAARTITEYTGLPINHVVIVDFTSFSSLIDKLGGVDIDVGERILSNRFDGPYATNERCQRWPGWRFARGKQHMNGHRALIYSRIRENKLNPRDTDITRSARQQQVMQALTAKLASASTFFKLPFIGGDLLKPLATDLSAIEFLQLGWEKFRASRTLHCRLGGSASGGYIEPSEYNRNVMLMVVGKSAPQPPPPNGDTFPPGCYVNRLPPGG
jgi:LCP family protein required for cell wall assembly